MSIKLVNEMDVTLIDSMGSDLSVVNAARVSFAKVHEDFDDDKDSKLIRYLAKHNHWSPFGHASLQFHIKAPVFVARQFVKHQIGLTWNEVSRRYVDEEPEFYVPLIWRGKADNKKLNLTRYFNHPSTVIKRYIVESQSELPKLHLKYMIISK